MLRSSLFRRVLTSIFGAAMALHCQAQGLARPTRLWSVGPLQTDHSADASKGSKQARLSGPSPALIQTGSSFAGTRSLVFAGQRIVLVLDLGERQLPGGAAPVRVTELISLDAKTGATRNTREFQNLGSAKLFATNDAHVILSGTRVLRLTPDLQDAGSFDSNAEGHKHGRIQNISPDGSTLGNGTSPGFELVDAQTFHTTWLTEAALVDSSVSSKGALTDKLLWMAHPEDNAFVDYVDAEGDHPLYHGKCGEAPVFLTDDLFLEQGCKDALILNLGGNLVRTLKFNLPWAFAGVSQNQQRFALQVTKPGTLFAGRTERFVIYTVPTAERIAELKPDKLPLEQSWTAFSPDGSLFILGSPLKLTLYRLP